MSIYKVNTTDFSVSLCTYIIYGYKICYFGIKTFVSISLFFIEFKAIVSDIDKKDFHETTNFYIFVLMCALSFPRQNNIRKTAIIFSLKHFHKEIFTRTRTHTHTHTHTPHVFISWNESMIMKTSFIFRKVEGNKKYSHFFMSDELSLVSITQTFFIKKLTIF